MAWGTPRGRTSTAQPGYVEARTTEEGAALLKAEKKGNKFHAVRTFYRDIWWDSKGEAAYTDTLEAMRLAGRIAWWEPHPSYVILQQIGKRKKDAVRGEIVLTLDYRVGLVGHRFPFGVLDFKSRPTLTRDFKMRAAVFVRVYPDIPFYVVGANGEWRQL